MKNNFWRQYYLEKGSGFVELMVSISLISVALGGVLALNLSSFQELRQLSAIDDIRQSVANFIVSLDANLDENTREVYQYSGESTLIFSECDIACSAVDLAVNDLFWLEGQLSSMPQYRNFKTSITADREVVVSVLWVGSESNPASSDCLFVKVKSDEQCTSYTVQI